MVGEAQEDVTKAERCEIDQQKDDEDQREWFRSGRTLSSAPLDKVESSDLGE